MPGSAEILPPDGGAGGPEAGVFTLPNAITFARLCAVPATIWLILQGRLDLAFWLFALAGLSDGLDGWLARVLNARSRLGALIDPLADKALLVSTFITLAAVGVLPDWIAILVVFRDLLIVGGVLLLSLHGPAPSIRPLFISKLNTVLQIGLAALALFATGHGWPGPQLVEAVVWIVAASTVASGAAYVVQVARR